MSEEFKIDISSGPLSSDDDIVFEPLVVAEEPPDTSFGVTKETLIAQFNGRMPHVIKSINMFWGTKWMNEFFGELLKDSRDGGRKGFPFELTSVLLKMARLHTKDFPQFNEDSKYDWFDGSVGKSSNSTTESKK